MKDKWLDDIHDRMAGFETDEPDNLWADLQKRLEKEKAVAPPALQRRNLLSGIRRYCAVAAILALIATTIIWMALPDNDVSLQIPHDGSSEIKRRTQHNARTLTTPLYTRPRLLRYIPKYPDSLRHSPLRLLSTTISAYPTTTLIPSGQQQPAQTPKFQKRPTLPAKPCRHRHPMAPYALTDRRAIIITTLPHTSDGKNTTTREHYR